MLVCSNMHSMHKMSVWINQMFSFNITFSIATVVVDVLLTILSCHIDSWKLIEVFIILDESTIIPGEMAVKCSTIKSAKALIFATVTSC